MSKLRVILKPCSHILTVHFVHLHMHITLAIKMLTFLQREFSGIRRHSWHLWRHSLEPLQPFKQNCQWIRRTRQVNKLPGTPAWNTVNFLDRLISMLSIDGQAACLRSGIDKSEYPFRDLSIVRPFNKCCYTSRGFKQPSSDQAEEAGH